MENPTNLPENSKHFARFYAHLAGFCSWRNPIAKAELTGIISQAVVLAWPSRREKSTQNMLLGTTSSTWTRSATTTRAALPDPRHVLPDPRHARRL